MDATTSYIETHEDPWNAQPWEAEEVECTCHRYFWQDEPGQEFCSDACEAEATAPDGDLWEMEGAA